MIRSSRFAFLVRQLFPRTISAVAALLVTASGIARPEPAAHELQSQSSGTSYALFEYMKVDPARIAEHRRLEREVWMPIHRERVRQGLIKSWSLWGMRFPGGTAREYDVIAITV